MGKKHKLIEKCFAITCQDCRVKGIPACIMQYGKYRGHYPLYKKIRRLKEKLGIGWFAVGPRSSMTIKEFRSELRHFAPGDTNLGGIRPG